MFSPTRIIWAAFHSDKLPLLTEFVNFQTDFLLMKKKKKKKDWDGVGLKYNGKTVWLLVINQLKENQNKRRITRKYTMELKKIKDFISLLYFCRGSGSI